MQRCSYLSVRGSFFQRIWRNIWFASNISPTNWVQRLKLNLSAQQSLLDPFSHSDYRETGWWNCRRECCLYFFCLLWLSFDQKIMSEWWAPRIAQPPTAAVYEPVPKLSWLMNGSASPGDEILRAGSHQPLSQKPFNGPNAVHPPELPDLCVLFACLLPRMELSSGALCVALLSLQLRQWSCGRLCSTWGFTTCCYREIHSLVSLYGILFFFFLQIDKRNQVHIAID